jgi:hypothetical protein
LLWFLVCLFPSTTLAEEKPKAPNIILMLAMEPHNKEWLVRRRPLGLVLTDADTAGEESHRHFVLMEQGFEERLLRGSRQMPI